MSTLFKTYSIGRIAIPGTDPVPGKPAYCTTFYNIYPETKQVYKKDTRVEVEIEVAPGTPGSYKRESPPTVFADYYGWHWFKMVPNPAYGTYHLVNIRTGGLTVIPFTVCYPAIPGRPGTPAIPELPTDYYGGWTGGARSINMLVADGTYKFKVRSRAVHVVTGFNDTDVDTTPEEINYGVRFTEETARVVEAGTNKTAAVAYSAADEFSIVRSGSGITYKKNGTTFYTSLIPSITSLVVDASLYYGGDYIKDAELTGGVPQPVYFTGTLPSIDGVLFANEVRLVGSLPGIGGSKVVATPPPAPVLRSVLQNITSFSIGLTGNIGALTGTLGNIRTTLRMDMRGRLVGVMNGLQSEMYELRVYTPSPVSCNVQAEGELSVDRALSASASSTVSVAGALYVQHQLAAAASATIQAAGVLDVLRTVEADAAAAATAAAALQVTRALAAAAQAAASASGALRTIRLLSGTASAIATASDYLQVARPQHLEIPEITIDPNGRWIVTYPPPVGVESPQQLSRVDDVLEVLS